MLPAMTADGIADKSPMIKRAMNTAPKLGTAATTAESAQYPSVDITWSVLRPKDSENGGKNIPPIPWPMRDLNVDHVNQ